MSVPMRPDDPAYFLLERGLADPSKRSKVTVFKKGCYICRDPEFSLMGMSVCQPCVICGEHVAADDVICDGPGKHDQYEEWCKTQEKEK